MILSSCTLTRLLLFQFDDVKDYRKFPSRQLVCDSLKFNYEISGDWQVPLSFESEKKEKLNFEEYLESKKTLAFLMIHNDTIVYEKYFDGYEKSSLVPSFSMAKSFLSILTGIAIDEGLIKSVKEPVTNYLPELKKNGFEAVTIENLLQMTSGIKCNENNLLYLAHLYYGRNMWKMITKLSLEKEPGTEFKYLNINAEILGFVLNKALNGKSLTQYMQEKLWYPLGMEYDASWSLDRKKHGMEKAYCCLNACARDYAKLGRLYMDKGKWNGKQIVSEQWVTNSIRVDTSNGSVAYNNYMWWLPSPNGDFMAAGRKGQFVYVNPAKQLVIVRLGRETAGVGWQNLFIELESAYFDKIEAPLQGNINNLRISTHAEPVK